ncbi:SH3 domain-containing protein [Bacillus lacus]|uniref:SH3 domain-containing protein n=1 Tax=Metabacillus lacus TaxID=1983721 RepID=A0A7X2IYC4_9BACI|nr:SH3 domain-containing protein [Metabacillus lacus]MRX71383.1 SH3 domain-containing protein [Metabacillus lacus]
MRKKSIWFLCFMLAAGLFHTQPLTIKAEEGSLTIAAENVHVRSGPGTSYSLIAKVEKGREYAVVERKQNWTKIRLSSGKSGWVANWLTSSPRGQEQYVQTAADDLRIRSGAGSKYDVIGTLAKGRKAKVLNRQGDWVKVAQGGTEGWVAAEYVNLGKTAAEPISVQSTATVNASSLNIRQAPDTASSIEGSAARNETVQVLAQNGEWSQIKKGNSISGWVLTKYLSSGKAGEKLPENSTGQSGKVTAGGLKVRESSSLSGKVKFTLPKGAKVTVLDSSGDWLYIEHDGNKGWTAGWYVSTSSSSKVQPEINTVTITGSGTNIRKGPDTSSSIAHIAAAGETFSVLGKDGDWLKVELPQGGAGFVASWVIGNSQPKETAAAKNSSPGLSSKTIVIDPGHGGRDGGAVGTRGTLEKDLTLKTAKLVYDKLKASGADVHLTRSQDTYISLPARAAASHYRNADAFISIHYDSSTDSRVHGLTTYYYSAADKPLASSIHNQLVKRTSSKSLGIRHGDFHVIRENNRPSVLLELGFLSNPNEELSIHSASYQEQVSQAIYYGLTGYLN